MPDIEWTTPPTSIRGHGGATHYFDAETRAALKARLGEWARVATGRLSTNSGLHTRYPDFQFTSRSLGRNADGRFHYDIYARYIGKVWEED